MTQKQDIDNRQQLIIFIVVFVLMFVTLIVYINYRPKIRHLEELPSNLVAMQKDIASIYGLVKVLAKNDSLQQSQLSHFPTTPLSIQDMRKVSSVFTIREDPVYGGREFHTGVDYNTDYGSIVYAAATGIVISTRYEGDYGNTIRMEHGNGYDTSYSHLSNITVIPGELVNQGDTIGNVGASGKTTGPHLHYEVSYTDTTGMKTKVNPKYFTQTVL